MTNWNKRCNIRKLITLDILIQLSDTLVYICSLKYQVIMFKAAFALAFSAFLRVREITVTQYRNDQNTLKYSEISLVVYYQHMCNKYLQTIDN